jgi:hypothetical protein
VWALVGLVAAPHEVAHLVALLPWTRAVRIEFDPTSDPRFGRRGLDRPLARFDAAVPATTPRWAIRLVAVAPLAGFAGLAVLVDGWLGLAGVSPTTVAATVAVAFWASLSDGDLAVLLDPDQVIDAGALVVRGGPRYLGAASTLLSVATTLFVGAVFVG